MIVTWCIVAAYLFYRAIDGVRKGVIWQMNSFKKPAFWPCYRKERPVLFWVDVFLSVAIGAAFLWMVVVESGK